MKQAKLIATLLILAALALVTPQSLFASEGVLTQVKPEKVCMITNQLFAKDQIPVEVEKKTYYGCCEMCKGKLKNDAASRVAIDPVSKKSVDKATAVIGAGKDGAIYYFENVANMAVYKP